MAREQKHLAETPPLTWAPCGTCWGQRKLVTLGPGSQVIEETCPSCLGVGERLQTNTRH